MSKFDNNFYAFPLAEDDKNYRADGMTLRDFFAIKAMASLLVGKSWHPTHFGADDLVKGWATGAYLIADIMLKEREK